MNAVSINLIATRGADGEKNNCTIRENDGYDDAIEDAKMQVIHLKYLFISFGLHYQFSLHGAT